MTVRADLHHHIDTDPVDFFVRHSAGALIDRAAALGVRVLAITCHESVPYDGDVTRYARERGVLLLRGMEATVNGSHVLLINFPEFPPGVCTVADIKAAKTPDSLVIAPHPFYPTGIAAADTLLRHPEVFDAVEFSGLYTTLTGRFNRRAAAHAGAVGLPVVGNSDTHFLWQLGRTYTLIDAEPEPGAVLEAIRRGRVELVTHPLSWAELVTFIHQTDSTVSALRDGLRYLARLTRRARRSQPAAAVRVSEGG